MWDLPFWTDTVANAKLGIATHNNAGAVMPGDDFLIDEHGKLSLAPDRVLTPEDITPEETIRQDVVEALEEDAD